MVLTPFCICYRISLQKMPSIRETLREMGVSVEQLLTELAQKSTDDPNNGTVPTPLTNYLDVRQFPVILVKRGIKSQRGNWKSRCDKWKGIKLADLVWNVKADCLYHCLKNRLHLHLKNRMILLPSESQTLHFTRLYTFLFDCSIPIRLSTMGKSVSALQPRCSTWCLTPAQQTCGCPRKAAPLSLQPVVSVKCF